jgi:phosphoribosyl 1,2-cyclic phosphodiesterase
MKLTFLGVRGSFPTPSQNANILWKLEQILASAKDADLSDAAAVKKFIAALPPHLLHPVGGNTACVELRHGDTVIVMDAGSGLRHLGRDLSDDSPCDESTLHLAIEAGHDPGDYTPHGGDTGPQKLHFLISHTHWDHIHGFPFFPHAYNPATEIAVYGREAACLARAFELQQTAPAMFPLSLSDLGARISFHTMPPEPLQIGDLRVTAHPLPHPGGSLAFRVEDGGGRSLIYATDYEFSGGDSPEADRFVDFIRDADVFISDSQYTYLEGAARRGWGHSTAMEAIDLAIRGEVKTFYMFHYDPNHTDAKLYEGLEKNRAYYNMMTGGGGMGIFLATESLSIEIS